MTRPSGENCILQDTEILSEEDLGVEDQFFNYPLGLLAFTVLCDETDIMVLYHGTDSFKGIYRKHGPTIPGNSETISWYMLNNATFGTTKIGSATVASVKFSLFDGKLGDSTITDGRIVDPGGSAISFNVIPLLSNWSQIILVMIFLIVALTLIHRRSQYI